MPGIRPLLCARWAGAAAASTDIVYTDVYQPLRCKPVCTLDRATRVCVCAELLALDASIRVAGNNVRAEDNWSACVLHAAELTTCRWVVVNGRWRRRRRRRRRP